MVVFPHRVAAASVLAAVFTATVATTLATSLVAQVNVSTYHNDNARSGLNASELLLTPALVSSGKFGLLYTLPVDGQIYGQPLVANGVAYVATENDSVYAFDGTGTVGGLLWHVNFTNTELGVTPVSYADVNCLDIYPQIGITSTPVLDLAGKTLYVVAATKENGNFLQRLHALDIATGAEKFGGPVVIQGSVLGSGDGSINGIVSFNALRQNQRAGLLLQDGAVYIGWAAYCDIDPYHGWVMAYDSQTLQQLGVWNTTPNGARGGVWQSGAGLAGDATGVYVVTGNGTADFVQDAGDSVIRLGLSRGTNQLLELDSFTAFNQMIINVNDVDIGSGGLLLLPTLPAGATHPNLAVTVGKEGRVYVVDRTNLGGFNAVTDQIVQELPGLVGGVFGVPAYWNNNVYFGGYNDAIKAFSFNAGGGGLLTTAPNSSTSVVFSFPGPTPSISSNGTANGIAWLVDARAYKTGGAGVLYAFDAANLATELWNSNQRGTADNPGPAIKFSVPTVANAHVYVGTGTQLAVYGVMKAALDSIPVPNGFLKPIPVPPGAGRPVSESQ